jgi:4'-phosphopantetheinyl transferase
VSACARIAGPGTQAAADRAPELSALSIRALCERLGSGAAAETRLSRWLTAEERSTYRSHRFEKRRREWLAGRIAAKDAVCRRHGVGGTDAYAAVEILALAEGAERGKPVYRLYGRPGPYGMSLSHSSGTVLVALGREPGQDVGVDLELPDAREPSFE